MKKISWFIFSLMTVLLILSACNSDEETEGDSEEENDDVVTLTFWNRYPELRGGFEDLIEQFEAEHPGIKIEKQEVPEPETQLRTALSEGDLPDMWTNIVELAELMEVDAVKNLDEIFTDDVKDQFQEGTWFENGTTADGSVYGFPLASPRSKAMIMYYNKDVFDMLGLTEDDIPASWEEFKELGQRIIDESSGAVYPIVWNNPGWANEQLVSMMGTAITPEVPWQENYKEGVPQVLSEGKVESAKFLKDLLDEGLMAPQSVEIGLGEAEATFSVGQSAFLWSGDWVGRQLFVESEFENWGVAPLPTKDGNPYYFHAGSEATSIRVDNETEHEEEVKTFLEYSLEHLHEVVYVNTGAGLPAKKEVGGEPPFEQYNDIMELENELAIPVPKPAEFNPEVVEFNKAYRNKLEVGGIGDVVVGYITGNINDLEAEIEKIDQDMKDAFLETLDEFPEVSQDDYIYPNWEPLAPYTIDKYDELR
ncbi:carbohydrate ABC transporter substrate-binding protein, CUT1 family [Gracilibacillus orientalis]|uniref:Carbohydrate ABC transporter substrate-binding protein, CUT1 family n=1 Tax=Gracilibacillus orientalis TaxID=334253 RepID=A0A1I4HTB6_9BACI|nr:extracellular solute-binding protein [Gracilibacillus orientalis]SFL45037.1 carbohydrate ABC transporter substrate-binding protein, CUT1 family [Gracilibacillus orientalis]